MVLSEEEISKIKSFIEEMLNFSCIECIYILPLYSFLDKKAGFSIVALYGYDEEYAKKLVDNELYGYDLIMEEIDKVDEIVMKYDICDRIYFNTAYSNDYIYPVKNIEQLSIANVANWLAIDNLVKIDNIERLVENNNYQKVLK